METLPAETRKSTSVKWIVIIFLSIMCLLTYTLIVIYSTQYFSPAEKQKNQGKINTSTHTAISGTIDLNGTAPQGATISLSFKKYGDTKSTMLDAIAATDGAVWTWNEAQSNTEYLIEAQVFSEGKVIGKSKTLVLIAPADSETLRINLPPRSAEQKSVKAAISGVFNINGYIPPTSTITLAARKVGDATFATIATNLSPVDNSSWSWIEALENAHYEIQATLLQNGSAIATSQVLLVTAPATNESITIQSTATLPASQPAAISGTINLNGYVPPSGSYITIGIRPTGNGQFTPIASNLSATDGISWNYANAQSGTTYDIQAYLWQNNTPFASSQILTVPAPATGEVLTINAMTPPSTIPSGNSISINCNSYSSDANLWQITVNYNNTSAIQNARQYWLTIGTNPGGNQQVSLITNPQNPNQTQTFLTGYSFNGTLTYYAQYAFATCANCNSFSPFSPSFTFSCMLPPTGTPIPSNTPTATPANTPIPPPTNTPIPTPTVTSTPFPTPTITTPTLNPKP